MLRRIFGNIVPAIDRLIERIPPHIRDIIQKAALAFAALIALIVIVAGINKGLREAKPQGFKLVERNRDLFYLQEMREEYAKKRKLVEDVDVDPLDFPSRQKVQDETRFQAMGRDTMGHLMGEKEEMLKHEDVMRPKEKSPGYLGDSYQVPRLAPDKKAIEDEEAHLTREKIGSKKDMVLSPPLPASAQKSGRDVFDDADAKGSQSDIAKKSAGATGAKKGKMEFIE